MFDFSDAMVISDEGNELVATLISPDDPAPDADIPEPLADRRIAAVAKALVDSHATRVLDLGCGEGRLLEALMASPQFTDIVGVDVSVAAPGPPLRVDPREFRAWADAIAESRDYTVTHQAVGELGYEIARDGERYVLSHPEHRRLVFVGDLIDRGPGVVDCLRLAMDAVKSVNRAGAHPGCRAGYQSLWMGHEAQLQTIQTKWLRTSGAVCCA